MTAGSDHASRQVEKRKLQVMTKHLLWLALLQKVRTLPPTNGPDGENSAAIADAITSHGLEEVLCGRHDNRPITFSRAFEIVYGQRLTLERAPKRAQSPRSGDQPAPAMEVAATASKPLKP